MVDVCYCTGRVTCRFCSKRIKMICIYCDEEYSYDDRLEHGDRCLNNLVGL